jgi:hypothetical protein
MEEIKRWEYLYETLSGGAFRSPKEEDVEAYLNEIGADGWEVFEIIQIPNTTKITVAAKRLSTTKVRHRHQFQEIT